MSLIGRLVKHYKGGIYVIIGHGREEATRNPVVIYKAWDNRGMEDLYTRPHENFYGKVEVNGLSIDRFSFMN